MPNRAMVSLSDVLAWGPQTEGIDEEVMSRCIDAASELIEQMCSVRFVETDYTAYHSGSKATGPWGETLWLADPNNGMTTPHVTALTCTEAGVEIPEYLIPNETTLPDSDCVLVGVDRGTLHRANISSNCAAYKAWAAGYSNIYLSYTAGWSLDTMPDDIKHAAIELSRLIYREGFRVGVNSMSGVGASASYRTQLSGSSNQAIDFWTLYRNARTLAP